MSEEIRKKIEEALVKRISKDSPGAYYTFIDERIITMRQARDVAEEIYQLAQEELDKLNHINEALEEAVDVFGEKIDDLSKIDPNQDELWIELLRTTMTLRKKSKTDETDKYLFDIEEAKKRYRITRVK